MAYIDQREIANFLAKELFYQQYITLEGLNSGVPTRTTPTLTPTTLKNIEQTFLELQTKTEPHENEAGFVPPMVHSIGPDQYVSVSDVDIYMDNSKSPSSMWHSNLSQSSSDSNTRSTPPLTIDQSTPSKRGTRRNMGGRKPNNDLNISPEEEERRKVRRERNKAAAARCRKRRVDHTNELVQQTNELEAKKQALHKEYQQLSQMKEELDFILENHRNEHCNLSHHQRPTSPPDVKPNLVFQNNVPRSESRVKTEIEPLPAVHVDSDFFSMPIASKRIMLSSAVPYSKPSRPNSLNFGATAPKATSNGEIAGIPINTPSTVMGLHQFNFDSLMVGGTGLTPVSAPLVPSCSSQQRNLPVSLADCVNSPDACGPPKLVSL